MLAAEGTLHDAAAAAITVRYRREAGLDDVTRGPRGHLPRRRDAVRLKRRLHVPPAFRHGWPGYDTKRGALL